ncbi:ABC transporter substrate-binding protein [Streptosporangium sp. NBC_01755]|uniref:ABC transporter substrate-binding protein n=1 Tax=unclassified Streptosporangium TaxID=2632669 RepID=UPI002DD8CFD3|nr:MULTISPECIES: ABC transporter substrate-binding protein [unclassified Streptosporangium]WSA26758.1 ABC transporter substrate-binding protein [Streptosporangium sp. NBC_01810]WSD01817.1 ABC transporter substrate-binding protein [Streptosporangium sp. NBC_01755]
MIEDTAGGIAATSAEATLGIELALSEINAGGGVDGKKLKLVRFSDGGEPSQSPALVRKLINADARIILMNSGSASAAQVKPVVQQEHIATISPTNILGAIAQPPNHTYSYILANPVTDVGTVYGAAFTKAGYKRVAVLTDDSPTMAGLNDALLPTLEKAGVNLVAKEKAPMNATDVTAQVSRLSESKPDAVLVSSLGGQLEVLFQNALKQALPSTPRFSLASIGNQPETWALAKPGTLDGLVYASAISSQNTRSNELITKLKARYGAKFKALTAFSAQGYDSVHLAAKVLKDAGSGADSKAINAALQKISGFDASFGGAGFTMSFSGDKHIGSDGLCGIVLRTFDAQNQPGQNWAAYQPSCN